MPRRLRRRIEASLRNADNAVDNVEASTLRVLTAVEEMLEEGISFRLEIAGKAIPIRLILEPDEEEKT